MSELSSLRSKKVLVTGHTGFKGGWLTSMLLHLGAEPVGYSMEPPSAPSFYVETGLENNCRGVKGDVRDLELLKKVIKAEEPELIFHLAAQPLVIRSYIEPIETFEINIMGTANVLEAARSCDSVLACVCITSDKCYENRGSDHAFKEDDRMGGSDPYSASKGAAELVISSYRHSFFKDGPLVASVRAGNVIGGGDWAEKRIIPDIVNCLSSGKPLVLRNPKSTRPWQHVLDPLNGYLALASAMLGGKEVTADAWNFGPQGDPHTVEEVAEAMMAAWGKTVPVEVVPNETYQESKLLQLNCEKATSALGWRPLLDFDEAIDLTVQWYKAWSEGKDMCEITAEQIDHFWRVLQ